MSLSFFFFKTRTTSCTHFALWLSRMLFFPHPQPLQHSSRKLGDGYTSVACPPNQNQQEAVTPLLLTCFQNKHFWIQSIRIHQALTALKRCTAYYLNSSSVREGPSSLPIALLPLRCCPQLRDIYLLLEDADRRTQTGDKRRKAIQDIACYNHPVLFLDCSSQPNHQEFEPAMILDPSLS